MRQREMPMLAGIAGIIRWIEELVNLLSGPLLTLGLGIALIDLLTDGSLLARLPMLLYAWAISQAVGVDAQLVATWDRARIALREGRYWALLGLTVLGGMLAYVAWVAAQVFALQESAGITTGLALSRLGMDSAAWLVQRTALSVFLVCLAGWTRYYAPAPDVAADAEIEWAKLEADLMLEPMRQHLRAQQARGVRSVFAAALGKDIPSTLEPQAAPAVHVVGALELDEKPSRPPTGGGSPMVSSSVRTGRQQDTSGGATVIRLQRQRTRRRSATQGRARGTNPLQVRTATVEAKARAAWQPGMSVGQLQHAAGISRSAAGKYRRTFLAEAANVAQAAQ